MFTADVLSALVKKDKNAQKLVFENLYSQLFSICIRYSKSQQQAQQCLNIGFSSALDKIHIHKNQTGFNYEAFFEKEIITGCVNYIKSIRNEYYVASTVYASESRSKEYDLFENNELIDFKHLDLDVLINSIQQLVPSQRLIFNLIAIDNYTLADAAILLEASEQTAKSNLEKARFNLQKNIEKNFKSAKYEQSF